jgi:transglutaminase superfamily protein
MKQRKTKLSKTLEILLSLTCGLAFGAVFTMGNKQLPPQAHAAPNQASRPPAPPSRLRELLALPADMIGQLGIATVNFLCAERLPSHESVDLSAALASLDDWSKRAQPETQRHLYKFQKNPAEFNHSEGYFRMLALIIVLQQDFGVRYNLERAQQPDYSKADDLFLTDVLDKRHQGTCVSLAVGRRLGYPLKLVTTKAHVFARWESVDGKERFNIEGTNVGLNCFPDDYYRTWPVPMTECSDAARQGISTGAPELSKPRCKPGETYRAFRVFEYGTVGFRHPDLASQRA